MVIGGPYRITTVADITVAWGRMLGASLPVARAEEAWLITMAGDTYAHDTEGDAHCLGGCLRKSIEKKSLDK